MERDPLYAVYVLILVLGLRKGEVLGLTWDDVDLDAGELSIGPSDDGDLRSSVLQGHPSCIDAVWGTASMDDLLLYRA